MPAKTIATRVHVRLIYSSNSTCTSGVNPFALLDDRGGSLRWCMIDLEVVVGYIIDSDVGIIILNQSKQL